MVEHPDEALRGGLPDSETQYGCILFINEGDSKNLHIESTADLKPIDPYFADNSSFATKAVSFIYA